MKREETTKTVKRMRQVEVSEEVKESFFVADDGKRFTLNTYYYPGQFTFYKLGGARPQGQRVATDNEMQLACALHDERYANALKAGLILPGTHEPALRRLAGMLGSDADELALGVFWVRPSVPDDIETIYAYLASCFYTPNCTPDKLPIGKMSLVVITEDDSGDHTYRQWYVYPLETIRKHIDDSIERLEEAKQLLPD
jgi:hypothetical protein